MKIRVAFKLNKSEGYDNNHAFTYVGYDGVEVNDIVVVNTRYGYAIAKVVEVDVNDNFNEDNLATVEKVIETAEYQRQEQKKQEQYNNLIKKIKRNQIETALLSLTTTSAEQDLIKNMTDKEIKTFYNALMK